MKNFIAINIITAFLCMFVSPGKLDAKTSIPLQDTIIGYFDFEQLQTPPYNTWFEYEYTNYDVDTSVLNKPEMQALHKINIVVIIGTWCPDSQRETPRFVKILDYLNYDTEDIVAIGVNRRKEAPYTELEELNIQYVPTIIFMFEGKEIGRIIELPEESLEKDMLNIISTI